MKLNNFEKYIDSIILSRGKEYFDCDLVENLEQDDDVWTCGVEGSHYYEIEVELKENKIHSWNCDCPYDGGLICKHVVATFYALRNEVKTDITKNTKTTKQVQNKTVNEQLFDIFNKISKAELQDFLSDQFTMNDHLQNMFIASFAESIDEDFTHKYKNLVNNIYKQAQGRHGFIDYYSTEKLTEPLDNLIDNAYKLLERNKIQEALVICQILIENIPIFIENVDDSMGSVGQLFTEAIELLVEISDYAEPKLKDELFKYCLKEFPMQKYSDFCFEENFLRVFPLLIANKSQEKQYLELVDKYIEKAKLSTSDHYLTQYLQEKINYFLNSNQERQAQILIYENKQYPEIRKILVMRAMDEEDYSNVKMLCKEGIEIANQKGHSGVKDDWYKKLLEIAKLEKNKTDIRQWVEVLFKNNYRNMDYYQQLKSTYSKNEWTAKCESILNDIKGKNKYGGLGAAQEIADIFVIEKYYDRLLKLMQLYADQIELIDRYSKYLVKKYPIEMIELYTQGIKKYAEQTGRPIYNQVAQHMKTLSKIYSSENTITEIIEYFKQAYKNRRAMMEVLRKNFPNQF